MSSNLNIATRKQYTISNFSQNKEGSGQQNLQIENRVDSFDIPIL
jgi:hypothetical protein